VSESHIVGILTITLSELDLETRGIGGLQAGAALYSVSIWHVVVVESLAAEHLICVVALCALREKTRRDADKHTPVPLARTALLQILTTCKLDTSPRLTTHKRLPDARHRIMLSWPQPFKQIVNLSCHNTRLDNS
jgi:hypothetical protein